MNFFSYVAARWAEPSTKAGAGLVAAAVAQALNAGGSKAAWSAAGLTLLGGVMAALQAEQGSQVAADVAAVATPVTSVSAQVAEMATEIAKITSTIGALAAPVVRTVVATSAVPTKLGTTSSVSNLQQDAVTQSIDFARAIPNYATPAA